MPLMFGNELEVLRIDPKAKLPSRVHSSDAGLDLFSSEDISLEIGETKAIKTGIAISVPEGYVGKIESRSSMALRGMFVSGGIIDSGYTGQVKIIMNNMSASNEEDPVLLTKHYRIKPGDKIAQLVIYPIQILNPVEVEELTTSERGEHGFGSSGAKA